MPEKRFASHAGKQFAVLSRISFIQRNPRPCFDLQPLPFLVARNLFLCPPCKIVFGFDFFFTILFTPDISFLYQAWLPVNDSTESHLPALEIIAADIVEDLQAALAQFAEIANDLKR